ncbi:MAG: hypothetical protein ACI4JW_10920 [Oscillospiraceae bacterium]
MNVNWLGESFEIPFGLGLIGITVILLPFLIIMIFTAKSMAKKTWVCQNCQERFNGKWYNFLISQHFDTDYYLRCPHCGKKGICTLSYKQDKD